MIDKIDKIDSFILSMIAKPFLKKRKKKKEKHKQCEGGKRKQWGTVQPHKTKQLRGKSTGQFTSVHVFHFLLITGSKYTMAQRDHGKGEYFSCWNKITSYLQIEVQFKFTFPPPHQYNVLHSW